MMVNLVIFTTVFRTITAIQDQNTQDSIRKIQTPPDNSSFSNLYHFHLIMIRIKIPVELNVLNAVSMSDLQAK